MSDPRPDRSGRRPKSRESVAAAPRVRALGEQPCNVAGGGSGRKADEGTGLSRSEDTPALSAGYALDVAFLPKTQPGIEHGGRGAATGTTASDSVDSPQDLAMTLSAGVFAVAGDVILVSPDERRHLQVARRGYQPVDNPPGRSGDASGLAAPFHRFAM